MVLFPEYFITDLFQIFKLVVINGKKDHSVVRQQFSCQQKTRIDHGTPAGMLLPSAVKMIRIGQRIRTGIVRRINVDHFYSAFMAVLQQF